jgi:hypothetical protein
MTYVCRVIVAGALLALGLALAGLWVAEFRDTLVSVVTVRADDPPYNVNVTTSLGHSWEKKAGSVTIGKDSARIASFNTWGGTPCRRKN